MTGLLAKRDVKGREEEGGATARRKWPLPGMQAAGLEAMIVWRP